MDVIMLVPGGMFVRMFVSVSVMMIVLVVRVFQPGNGGHL